MSKPDRLGDELFSAELQHCEKIASPFDCSGLAGENIPATFSPSLPRSFDIRSLHTGPIDLREVRSRPGLHTYVVLDTSVLVKDWFLQGAGFSALKDACSLINAQLVIPEVVLDELLPKYHEAVRKAIYGVAQVSQGPVDLDKETEAKMLIYREFISQLCQALAVITMPYPRVSHRDVVRRIYEGKRPFHGGESGYKDFLIWRSIVDLIERKEQWDFTRVVFISANLGDFAESKTDHRLHEDFLADLTAEDREQARIVYFSSVEAYSRSLLGDGFEQLTKLHSNVSANLRLGPLPMVLNEFLSVRRPERQWIVYEPGQLDFTVSYVHRMENDRFLISGMLDFTPWWYNPTDGSLMGDNVWDAEVALVVNRDLNILKADIDGESVIV